MKTRYTALEGRSLRTTTLAAARVAGFFAALFAVLFAAGASLAASPPDRMHYQGVLRDAAGDPLDGTFSMTFRLFDAETLGDEILVDSHLGANDQAVDVDGGMFSVLLGSGQVSDGSGPGTYTSLTDVFAAHSSVWLEIQVEAETLSPRLSVAAAAYALNAATLAGNAASDFIDVSADEQFKAGKLVVGKTSGTPNAHGLEAYGDLAGGYFFDIDDLSYAYAAIGDYGVQGFGAGSGGFFQDTDSSGWARVGGGDYGVEGYGDFAGAYFGNSAGNGMAYISLYDKGIRALGSTYGGQFENTVGNGASFAGAGNTGIYARGSGEGGKFEDTDGTSLTYVARGSYGVDAEGDAMGGYFRDASNSGYAYVGYGDRGVHGVGTNSGGYFNDSDTSSYTYAGFGSYKVWGTGAVSFVQNHPDKADKVVVYHAPESSEVGVYTRGSARLIGGAATVALDPTFPWVTNPDLGLTAHLTPRSGCVVYVESVGSSELTVRSDDPGCDDAAFDYMVWGLRIGFENSTAVQPKVDEAYIPSMAMHEEFLRERPELSRFTAGERFRDISRDAFGVELTETPRARELLEKIHVFDPAIDPMEVAHLAPAEEFEDVDVRGESGETGEIGEIGEIGDGSGPVVRDADRGTTGSTSALDDSPAPHTSVSIASTLDATRSSDSSSEDADRVDRRAAARVPVAEPVDAGDLLAVDETGSLVVAMGEANPNVVGIATESAVRMDDDSWTVAVATSGFATLEVDADYGSIRPGDLLVASSTPGHAMRAYTALPGTVIAKALEPLESGRGTIRVVLTLR